MKVEGLFIVTRVKGEVYDAESITDMYSEVSVAYNPNHFKESDLINWGKSIYGTSVYRAIGVYLDAYNNGECFNLQSEAKDLPSFGDFTVGIESIDIEINQKGG